MPLFGRPGVAAAGIERGAGFYIVQVCAHWRYALPYRDWKVTPWSSGYPAAKNRRGIQEHPFRDGRENGTPWIPKLKSQCRFMASCFGTTKSLPARVVRRRSRRRGSDMTENFVAFDIPQTAWIRSSLRAALSSDVACRQKSF